LELLRPPENSRKQSSKTGLAYAIRSVFSPITSMLHMMGTLNRLLLLPSYLATLGQGGGGSMLSLSTAIMAYLGGGDATSSYHHRSMPLPGMGTMGPLLVCPLQVDLH